MKRVGMLIGIALIVLYLAAVFVPFEPEERRPGTRLGGDPATGQPDEWEGRKQIFVQTRTWYGIPHSVTTVAWFRDGALYVPCGNCATKRWPQNVADDPRVRLKIDSKLYDRTAVPINDVDLRRRIFQVPEDEPLPDGVALYRMDG